MNNPIENRNSVLSLSQLTGKIKGLFDDRLADTFWVTAEISDLKVHSTGHCYLELIEKSEGSDQLKAKMRATIWAYTFRMMRPYFESVTGYHFSTGLKILIHAKVEFHDLYGISLNIHDIDPSYTLGDFERQKQEIVSRLEKEGVISMNRELSLSSLPKTIAIISSSTAAGYEDFIDQLVNNPYGYMFHTKLFPTLMQGDKAVRSILHSFDKIFQFIDIFDAVVIIRGGGSKAELAPFNSYELPYYITQFPLPVITGIGHERDDTITDLVAHTRLKTPTAVAEFLVGRFIHLEGNLMSLISAIQDRTRNYTLQEYNSLVETGGKIRYLAQSTLHREYQYLDRLSLELRNEIRGTMTDQYRLTDHLKDILKRNLLAFFRQAAYQLGEKPLTLRNRVEKIFLNFGHDLSMAENLCKHLDPVNIMKRGYSYTLMNGKIVKSAGELRIGDTISTKFHEGSALSKVEKLHQTKGKT